MDEDEVNLEKVNIRDHIHHGLYVVRPCANAC